MDVTNKFYVSSSTWSTGVGEPMQKVVMPIPFRVIVDAENMKPCVFLVVEAKNGIWPIKFCTKTLVGKIKEQLWLT